MTIRIAHASHRWNLQDGTCRLCGCSSTKKPAAAPCPKGKVVAAPKVRRAPTLHDAALRGAKDLLPPVD